MNRSKPNSNAGDTTDYYAAMTKRINHRCDLLGVKSVEGIPDPRLAAIRHNTEGISTLELTQLSRALHVQWLVFGT